MLWLWIRAVDFDSHHYIEGKRRAEIGGGFLKREPADLEWMEEEAKW